MTDENYPDIGKTIDNVYTLTKGIGKGGYARVYHAEVNLDAFDYATVVAYREKREKKQAAGIAPSRGQHFEKIEKRLEELRSPEWVEKIKIAVEKVPDFYPYTGACAVKILEMPPELKGQDRETRIERFEGEWKNLMGITHPNVIRVYGGAKTEINGRETYYYAMEILEQILDDETITKKPYEEKTDIIKKAALGLRAIQSHQLVHRDVKPDNILVTRIGEVKVTDAGIAKDLMRDSDMTLTQAVIGTPHFESPEQVVGTKNVDFRTDIYSLGGAFYKWLTGVKPYGDNEELTSAMDILYVLRKLHDYTTGIERNVYRITRLPADIVLPTPVDELCDIPEKVVDVLEKMMNPDKEIFRHQTMDEVITDLNAILQGEATSIELEKLEVASEKGEKVEQRRIEKEKKKKKTVVFAGVGGALALILIIAAVFLLGNKDKDKKQIGSKENETQEETADPVEQENIRNAQLDDLYNKILSQEKREPDNLDLLEQSWQNLRNQGKGTEYETIAGNKLTMIAQKRKEIAKLEQKKLESPEEQKAGELFRAAQDHAAGKPQDFDGAISLYAKVIEAGKDTSYAGRAQEKITALKKKQEQAVQQAFEKFQAEINMLVKDGEYKKALEKIDQAKADKKFAPFKDKIAVLPGKVNGAKKAAAEKALQKVFSSAVELMIEEKYQNAELALANAITDMDMLPPDAKDDLKTGLATVKTAEKMSKRIEDGFKKEAGKKISVKTKTGQTKSGKLSRVEYGKLYLEISFAGGTAVMPVALKDLAFAEKLKRLGRIKKSEELVAVTAMAFRENNVRTAERCLEKTEKHPMHSAFLEKLDDLKMGVQEAAAKRKLMMLINTAGIRNPAAAPNLAKTLSALSIEEKTARKLEKELEAYEKEHSETKYFEENGEIIDALAASIANTLGRPTIHDVFSGKVVKYDPKTRRIELFYDFSDQKQFNDWEIGKGNEQSGKTEELAVKYVEEHKPAAKYKTRFQTVTSLSSTIRRVEKSDYWVECRSPKGRVYWCEYNNAYSALRLYISQKKLSKISQIKDGGTLPFKIFVEKGDVTFQFGNASLKGNVSDVLNTAFYQEISIGVRGICSFDDIRICGILDQNWLTAKMERIKTIKEIQMLVKRGGKGTAVLSKGVGTFRRGDKNNSSAATLESYDMRRSSGWAGPMSFIRFDLSQIPKNSTLLNVRLRMWCVRVGGKQYKKPDKNIGVAEILRDVDIEKCTSAYRDGSREKWGEKGPKIGTDISKHIAVGPQQIVLEQNVPCWMEWESEELKGVVQSWVSGKTPNRGFCVHGLSTNLLAHFASFNHADQGKHPQLVIEYTGARTRTTKGPPPPEEIGVIRIRTGSGINSIQKAFSIAQKAGAKCVLEIQDNGTYDGGGTLGLHGTQKNERDVPLNVTGIRAVKGCWPTVKNLRLFIGGESFRLEQLKVESWLMIFSQSAKKFSAFNCAFVGGKTYFNPYSKGNRNLNFEFENCVFYKVRGEMNFGACSPFIMKNCIASECGPFSTERSIQPEYVCFYKQGKIARTVTFEQWMQKLKNKETVFTDNPRFVNPEEGDFRLDKRSPLRYKGPDRRHLGIQWEDIGVKDIKGPPVLPQINHSGKVPHSKDELVAALKAVNPEYNGKGDVSIENGRIVYFNLRGIAISDITPLKGMTSLKRLNLEWTQVKDLSPLQGLQLTELYCNDSKISDLTPLKGMPLRVLTFWRTRVSDLTPLEGMPLQKILFRTRFLKKGMDTLRRIKTLRIMGTGVKEQKQPAEEFWRKYDAGEYGPKRP
ncbi:protein kinase [Planctomycetota bacterium]